MICILIGLRCAFWAWSCGFCGVIFSGVSFYFYFHYIYVKEFAMMLKMLVDLLWWIGLIFGDLYYGGCKTMVVGLIFENCNWWVCGLLEVVETENGRRKVSMFQAS